MKYVEKIVVLSLLAGILIIGVCSESVSGKEAPEFRLKDAMTGETVELSDFEGSVVVLDFFSTECIHCGVYLEDVLVPLWRNHYSDDQRVQFLSINVYKTRTRQELREYAADLGVDWPVLMGSGTGIREKYGVQVIPAIFVVGPGGEIEQNYVHPKSSTLKNKIDEVIAEVWKPADFEVGDLAVSPENVEPGEIVEVSATVTNVGGAGGKSDVEFVVDDFVEDNATVELEGGQSTTVSFETSREKEGVYDVMIVAQDNSEMGIFTVEEKVVEHGLTIDVEGEGTTTPAPETHFYEQGEEVTVEAVPEEGWVFDRWIGDVENSDSMITKVTMDENKEVRAVFVEPAELEVSNLNITPGEVEPEENLTISVEVANVGGETDNYDVWLEIDGEREDSKSVSLSPDESETVEFTTSRENEGQYNVAVDGITGSFTVESSEEWVPYIPETEEVEIGISPTDPSEENEITAEVTVNFPDQGYLVKDKDGVSRDNTVFSVNVEVERFTGPSPAAVKSVESSYSLGHLQEDSYKFRYIVGGETVETKEFIVRKLNPADFEVGDLAVSTENVEPGEIVEVSATVRNVGDETDERDVGFLINNVLENNISVKLEGGQSKTIEFKTSRENKGEYAVSIDTQDDLETRTFTLQRTIGESESEEGWPWMWIGIVITLAIATIILIFFNRTRARSGGL